MIDWLLYLPLIAGIVVTLVAPGYFWARASIRSSVVAAAISPAMVTGFLVILGQVYDWLSLPWSRWTALPVLTLITVGGVLFWRSRRESNPESAELFVISPRPPLTSDVPSAHAYRLLTKPQRRLTWGLIGIGWLIAALPTLMIALPTYPAQQWDAVFHVNGVWHLLQDQRAGLTTSLVAMFGGTATYYPAAWHITTALFATTTTVTQTANAMSLALMFIWVLTCTAFTSVVTTSRAATYAAPLVAGMMLSMPSDSLTMYVQWPHAFGVAMLPGVVAALLVWGRRLMRATESSFSAALVHVPLGVFLFFGSIGLAHSHASALFALAWTIVFPCVAGAYAVVRRRGRDSQGIRAAAVLVGAAVAFVPIALLTTKQLRGMGSYPRQGISWEYALTHALVPLPPLPQNIDLLAAGITFLVLSVVGGYRLYSRTNAWESARAFALKASSDSAKGTPVWERRTLGPKPALWLVAAYALWSFATFVAYSPEDTIRVFWLSPWYMDPRRIMGVQNMVMVPLISIGFAGLVTWLRAHRSRAHEEEASASSQWRIGILVGLWLLVISVLGAFDSRLSAAQYVYDPDNLGKPGMLTAQELAMVERVPDTIPEGARILGDPIAGAAYVESIGQREAFFPQLTTAYTGKENASVFLEHFNEIHTNPTVCEALKAEGIEYVYLDADGKYYSFARSERAPGLYNVDVSRGFEMIDQGDQAALYRITACQ